MNTHKTFSLLAAVLVVAGQAALFAVDTHASTQAAAIETVENGLQAQNARTHAVSLTASTLHAAGTTQGA